MLYPSLSKLDLFILYCVKNTFIYIYQVYTEHHHLRRFRFFILVH